MTQGGAARPEPADDDVIDVAVRERLGALLDLGADWMGRDLLGRVDPLSLLPALARTGRSVAAHPLQLAGTLSRGAATATKAGSAAMVRALGGSSEYSPLRARDKRFADPTWSENAAYWHREWGQRR